jgi:hypothetical protein
MNKKVIPTFVIIIIFASSLFLYVKYDYFNILGDWTTSETYYFDLYNRGPHFSYNISYSETSVFRPWFNLSPSLKRIACGEVKVNPDSDIVSYDSTIIRFSLNDIIPKHIGTSMIVLHFPTGYDTVYLEVSKKDSAWIVKRRE